MRKADYLDNRTPTRDLDPMEILIADVDILTAQRGKSVRTTMLGFEDQRDSDEYQLKLNNLLKLPGTRNVVLSTINQKEASEKGFVRGWFRVDLK